MKSGILFLPILVAVALWPSEGWAYLDPATGSLLLQAVIGGIASVTVGVGIFWQRIKSFFVRNARPPSDDTTTDD